MRNFKGLTLIEVMVTLAILGVVAAIAIPAYKGYVTTSHRSECQNEVAAIKLAEEEFFLDNNSYFTGVGSAALAAASNNIYQPSAPATPECTYEVTSAAPATTYTILAHPAAGGHLTAEADPILTFTK